VDCIGQDGKTVCPQPAENLDDGKDKVQEKCEPDIAQIGVLVITVIVMVMPHGFAAPL
jgi:hypothetical protein